MQIVCAGHGTELVGWKVPIPGVSGAEGKEKDKGVTVRWGREEVQSEHAGRRTGTGYEVWYTRDELARDNEVLHPHGGVLYKSGVYAWKVRCLTPGDLPCALGGRVRLKLAEG